MKNKKMVEWEMTPERAERLVKVQPTIVRIPDYPYLAILVRSDMLEDPKFIKIAI